MLDRGNDGGRLADIGQPTPLLVADGNIHSLLNNSRRVPNFEFIRFLWMITSHKERYYYPLVVSPLAPLSTGSSNHERTFGRLPSTGSLRRPVLSLSKGSGRTQQ
jgi:hypothetical protein